MREHLVPILGMLARNRLLSMRQVHPVLAMNYEPMVAEAALLRQVQMRALGLAVAVDS